MHYYFILGNIFSFIAAICFAVSVFRKKTQDLLLWQVFEVVFCILSSFALYSYSAVTTNTIDFIRNILAWKNKLTKKITILLLIAFIVFGLIANTRGIIGILPVVSALVYTVCLYMTRDIQKIRFILIICMGLWLVHDLFIGAYIAAVTDTLMMAWTLFNLLKNARLKK